MTDFRKRLEQAAERGRAARDAETRRLQAESLSEEECRRLHSDWRHTLEDHIDECLAQLADGFPGFRHEPVVSEKGRGAAVRRDDLSLVAGKRENLFSRLELTISSYNSYRVLEIVARGAVRNKETFHRNHYQKLGEVEIAVFQQLIEQWTLDYAEQYAAAT
jgi:hypothetical protein